MLVVAAGGDLAGVHVRHQALQHPGHPAPQPAGARAAAAPRPSPPGRGGQGHATMLAALRCAPRPRGRAGPGRAAALPPPPAGRALRRRAPPGRHLTPVTWRGARHLATANGAPGRAVSPRLRGARAREAAGSRPARGHGLPRDRDRDRYWFRYRDLPRPRRTAHSAAPLRRRGPTGRSDPRRRALGAAARPGPAAPAALCPVCALARPATAGKGSRRPAPPPPPRERHPRAGAAGGGGRGRGSFPGVPSAGDRPRGGSSAPRRPPCQRGSAFQRNLRDVTRGGTTLRLVHAHVHFTQPVPTAPTGRPRHAAAGNGALLRPRHDGGSGGAGHRRAAAHLPAPSLPACGCTEDDAGRRGRVSGGRGGAALGRPLPGEAPRGSCDRRGGRGLQGRAGGCRRQPEWCLPRTWLLNRSLYFICLARPSRRGAEPLVRKRLSFAGVAASLRRGGGGGASHGCSAWALAGRAGREAALVRGWLRMGQKGG